MSNDVLEVFVPFPGYEGKYEISNLGRVKSFLSSHKRKGDFIKPLIRDDGYLQVCFLGDSWLLHRAVLWAFIGPQPKGMQGAHLDGNKGNCALANLAWVTPKENNGHKKLHGTNGQGESNAMARLTEASVKEIRASYIPRSKHNNCAAIGNRFGISFQAVWDIVHYRRWKHI